MARTNKKVGYSPTGKLEVVTPDMAASGIEAAFRMLEGRWKMVIIFHLFDRSTLRFSELERTIPGVSQKMLIQQLRELERDGIVSTVLQSGARQCAPLWSLCSNGPRHVRNDSVRPAEFR